MSGPGHNQAKNGQVDLNFPSFAQLLRGSRVVVAYVVRCVSLESLQDEVSLIAPKKFPSSCNFGRRRKPSVSGRESECTSYE
ncbi:hypothetical protein E2C01_082265 [Portunus trituberculatus]|uniref:Uncharacterized protein n=1 Tax=Portunus trituberculatus TaxID=210409 RepID=A0A5B7J4F4_PORTR|nr:hypothetical protein [Portunus trituberculatus]